MKTYRSNPNGYQRTKGTIKKRFHQDWKLSTLDKQTYNFKTVLSLHNSSTNSSSFKRTACYLLGSKIYSLAIICIRLIRLNIKHLHGNSSLSNLAILFGIFWPVWRSTLIIWGRQSTRCKTWTLKTRNRYYKLRFDLWLYIISSFCMFLFTFYSFSLALKWIVICYLKRHEKKDILK